MIFLKWGAKFTFPPTLGKIFFFCRVLGRFSIVLEFLTLFAKSSGELLPKKKIRKKLGDSCFLIFFLFEKLSPHFSKIQIFPAPFLS